jgi:isoquinoline 1-oxidoreductase subunit alpha
MVKLQINGEDRELDVAEDTPLLWVIRDELGLTGTKFGCGISLCGACTVHVDGVATRSCVTAVGDVEGSAVTTIEAVAGRAAEAVQAAWDKLDVVQCGYCQSGQVMSAVALLSENPRPRRPGHRRRHERQRLPLRHLCPYPRRHPRGGRPDGGLRPCWRTTSTAPSRCSSPPSLPRRRPCRPTGGSFSRHRRRPVSVSSSDFAFAGGNKMAAAAAGDADGGLCAQRLRPRGPDNTVTVLIKQFDMGQGVPITASPPWCRGDGRRLGPGRVTERFRRTNELYGNLSWGGVAPGHRRLELRSPTPTMQLPPGRRHGPRHAGRGRGRPNGACRPDEIGGGRRASSATRQRARARPSASSPQAAAKMPPPAEVAAEGARWSSAHRHDGCAGSTARSKAERHPSLHHRRQLPGMLTAVMSIRRSSAPGRVVRRTAALAVGRRRRGRDAARRGRAGRALLGRTQGPRTPSIVEWDESDRPRCAAVEPRSWPSTASWLRSPGDVARSDGDAARGLGARPRCSRRPSSSPTSPMPRWSR